MSDIIKTSDMETYQEIEMALIEELANELGLEIHVIKITVNSFIKISFIGTRLLACIDMFISSRKSLYSVKLYGDSIFNITFQQMCVDRNEMLCYIKKHQHELKEA